MSNVYVFLGRIGFGQNHRLRWNLKTKIDQGTVLEIAARNDVVRFQAQAEGKRKK